MKITGLIHYFHKFSILSTGLFNLGLLQKQPSWFPGNRKTGRAASLSWSLGCGKQPFIRIESSARTIPAQGAATTLRGSRGLSVLRRCEHSSPFFTTHEPRCWESAYTEASSPAWNWKPSLNHNLLPGMKRSRQMLPEKGLSWVNNYGKQGERMCCTQEAEFIYPYHELGSQLEHLT